MQYNLTSRNIKNFFKHVDQQDDGCWRWNGEVKKSQTIPIPLMFLNGQKLPARRIGYLICLGVLPDDWIKPTCGNHRCVNPFHTKDSKNPFETDKEYRSMRYRKERYKIEIINKIIKMYNSGQTRMSIAKALDYPYIDVCLIIRMARFCKASKLSDPTKGAKKEKRSDRRVLR